MAKYEGWSKQDGKEAENYQDCHWSTTSNTWQSPSFTSFTVADLIHLRTKIKMVKMQLLRKWAEDNCHRRYILRLQLPRCTSWYLLKQLSSLKYQHLLWLMILLSAFYSPYDIYCPCVYKLVHASTRCSFDSYRKNCFSVKQRYFITYTTKG